MKWICDNKPSEEYVFTHGDIVEKTKKYYAQLNQKDICQCDYCQNYVHQIKASYPGVAEYLTTLGVDVEKPFETMPLEPENGFLEYISAQYIVMGKMNEFPKTVINDVSIDIAKLHPSTDIEEEHFVIEIFPLRLKWDR